jgi:hypothetical protein
MVRLKLKIYKDVWVYIVQIVEEKAVEFFIPKILDKISSKK